MILDSETAAMIEVATRLAPMMLLRQTGIQAMGTDVPLRPEMEAWFRTRLEMIRTGLDRVPSWFQKKVHRFDPELRIRWDLPQEHADKLTQADPDPARRHRIRDAYWLLEHYSSFDGYYHPCGYWEYPLGERLFEELRRGDLRKKTPGEHVAEERERSEKKQAQNDQFISDQMAEAVDNMSTKQIQNFIDVSEAWLAGDTITAHGDDLKFMERLEAKNKELAAKGLEIPDRPEDAENPGMKPGLYQRKKRE